MPYSTPGTQAPSRPVHHHARSSSASFSDERGPGAFVSLGSLPRRKAAPKKQPVFHFREDDDESESPESDDVPHDLPQKPSGLNARLSVDTQHLSPSFTPSPARLELPSQQSQGVNSRSSEPASVPFPRSSPLSPSSESGPIPNPDSFSQPSGAVRPSLSRTGSSPVVLSNGKPLKSSLKSSSSTPDIPNEVRSLHLRARSAPSTPSLGHKNVHFAEKDGGLESIRVFSRSAKPASLSKQPDDETETETEQDPPRHNAFPFPRFPSPSGSGTLSPPSVEIDTTIPGATTPIPSHAPPPYANVHLESLTLSPPKTAPVLSGTLVVRNLSYEKHVAVRFTLDDWQTTSEVSARHTDSLPALPKALAAAGPGGVGHTVGDAVGVIATQQTALWDRFSFTIRLEDYAHKLHERVVWLVARYTGTGVGEWWDNNSGRNYRVGFRVRRAPLIPARHITVSAPAPLAIPNMSEKQTQPEKQKQPATQLKAPPAPPAVSFPQLPPTLPSPSNSPTTSPGSRGRRLSLTNYAAPTIPSPVPSVLITPPMTPDDEGPSPSLFGDSTPTPTNVKETPPRPFPRAIIGGMPATSSPNSLSIPGQNVSLHWPWGSSTSASDLVQIASPHQLSPPRSGNGSPNGGTVNGQGQMDSDSLYKAFVKRWCFAQSPPPSPSVFGPGPPGAVGGDGVLVG